MSSCVQPNFEPILHPRWPPQQPSWKSCYLYSCRNYSNGIYPNFTYMIRGDVWLCLTKFWTDLASKMAAMASSLKILFMATPQKLLEQILPNQFHIHDSWWSLVVPNQILGPIPKHPRWPPLASHLENLVIATSQKLSRMNFNQFLLRGSCWCLSMSNWISD